MIISPIKITNKISFKQSNINGVIKADTNLYRLPQDILCHNPIKYPASQFVISMLKPEYRPLASMQPIIEPVGHYNNLDKFSELFAKKINSQLLAPTQDDVENLILRVQRTTGASKKTIKEILYNLTAFSGYKALDEIIKPLAEYNIGQFGIDRSVGGKSATASLSNFAVNYLLSKGFSDFAIKYLNDSESYSEYTGRNNAIILDNSTLSALENLKKSTNPADIRIYEAFINRLRNNQTVFLNIKGWDIKTRENEYKNANFLTGSGYLEYVATQVAKRVMQGENPNQIYYSDFRERLYKLLGDEFKPEDINVVDINPQDSKTTEITSSDILDNIMPNLFTKEQIKNSITDYMQYKRSCCREIITDRKLSILLKYLDEHTHVFSIDSLALALKNMKQKIENMAEKMGNGKEVACIIPQYRKSFDLITAMYANVNNISSENINYPEHLSEENKQKTKVFLDDISASGLTELNSINIYRTLNGDDTKIIYAPIVLCKKAISVTMPEPDSYKHCYELYLEDLAPTRNSSTNPDVTQNDELLEVSKILDKGFRGMGLSVAFPYMIPDNCSDLAFSALGNLLFYDIKKSNNSPKLKETTSNQNNSKPSFEIPRERRDSTLERSLDEDRRR